ncbi:hypothetical protein CRT60_21795 [Azospirillum palustre]|uniref:Uncharacterized protein n=1 Tax=Azospirillum palustre TaxID=2044885 RepID=A0A2B8BEB5_9PROT|nr:hypothetical protein [Azospirillum palustre]PGH55888.1 hypothetical protein CRT60_21795 [Azospirillum palustre]
MTNGYFNHDNPESKRTLARAESVNATFEAVAAGFDLLPDDMTLKQGRATWATATGGPATYLVTLPFNPQSYATGLNFRFKVPATSTGACAINVMGPTGLLGAKALRRFNGDDTLPDDLVAGAVADVAYDGAKFVLVGQHGATEMNATVAVDAATRAEAAADRAAIWDPANYLSLAGGALSGWLRSWAGVDASNLGLRIGEATSGFYRSALGVIGFVVNGIEVFRTAANGTLTFRRPVVPKVVTVPWASTITLDLTAGNKFAVTMAGGTTFGPPALTDDMEGMEFTILPMQDGTGSRSVAFDSLFRFPGGAAPIPSATAGKRDRAICEVVRTLAGTLAIDAVYVKGF